MNDTIKEACLSFAPLKSQTSDLVLISVYFTSVINALSMLTAVAGNIMIVTILWKFERLQLPSNIFVCSLCLCDLIIGLIAQPLSIVNRMTEVRDKTNCQLKIAYRYFCIFSIGLSVISIAMISMDRCLAITLPYRYQKLSKSSRYCKAVIMVWITWGIVAVVPLINLLPLQICYQLLFAFHSIILLSIIVSYCLIIRVMYRQRRRIVAAVPNSRIHYTDKDVICKRSGVFLGALPSSRMHDYSLGYSRSEPQSSSDHTQERETVQERNTTSPSISLTVPSQTSARSSLVGASLLTLQMATTSIESANSSNSLADVGSDFDMRRKRKQSIFKSTRDFAADVVKRSIKQQSQRSGTSTVVIVITCLFLCYLPKTVLYLITGNFKYNDDKIYIVDTWTDMFIFLNSTLNPFIYSLRSKDIKDCIYRLVKRNQDSWQLED